MKQLTVLLSIFVLFFVNACTTPDIANPFASNVKKEYFTGGQLRSEFFMTDSTGHNGLLKKYGYNGKLNSTVPIVNGMKEGDEKLYDAQGRMIKKTPYVRGKKEGVMEAYYPNGDVMIQISYLHDLKHGKAVKYNKDGSINQEVTFYHGELAS